MIKKNLFNDVSIADKAIKTTKYVQSTELPIIFN